MVGDRRSEGEKGWEKRSVSARMHTFTLVCDLSVVSSCTALTCPQTIHSNGRVGSRTRATEQVCDHTYHLTGLEERGRGGRKGWGKKGCGDKGCGEQGWGEKGWGKSVREKEWGEGVRGHLTSKVAGSMSAPDCREMAEKADEHLDEPLTPDTGSINAVVSVGVCFPLQTFETVGGVLPWMQDSCGPTGGRESERAVGSQ